MWSLGMWNLGLPALPPRARPPSWQPVSGAGMVRFRFRFDLIRKSNAPQVAHLTRASELPARVRPGADHMRTDSGPILRGWRPREFRQPIGTTWLSSVSAARR